MLTCVVISGDTGSPVVQRVISLLVCVDMAVDAMLSEESGLGRDDGAQPAKTIRQTAVNAIIRTNNGLLSSFLLLSLISTYQSGTFDAFSKIPLKHNIKNQRRQNKQQTAGRHQHGKLIGIQILPGSAVEHGL